MKKISILCFTFVLIATFAKAQDTKIISPDGKLEVTVGVNAGIPVYSVSYNGKVFLKSSPIGMKTNVGDFSKDLSISEKTSQKSIDETYSLPNIKKSNVHYQATETVLTFNKAEKSVFDVVFRVSNNDVAFRYKVYPQKDRLSCVVNEETSGFVFPEGTTTFLCPQSKPMVGFARTMPSYETGYTPDAPMGKNGNDNNGFTFPCLFKVGAQGWVLISETGVDSRYCGSRLIGHEGGLYTIGFPMEGENNGNGTVSPGIALRLIS